MNENQGVVNTGANGMAAPVTGVNGSESVEDLLRQILDADKKEVKYAKRAAFFMMCIFVIFLVAAIIIVPKVVETLANVNTTVITAGKTLESANAAIDNINTMSASNLFNQNIWKNQNIWGFVGMTRILYKLVII